MLIVVEGCVGAGKSTVSAGLAHYRESKVLLEHYEANPFLKAFYQNPELYAMETEFAFLLIHTHQLKKLVASPAEEVITDFYIDKDSLYAQLNLHDSSVLSLFQGMFNVCVNQVPRPDMMICLSASKALIRSRIVERHREFELEVDPEYFDRVNEVYDEFFDSYEGKKLRVSMDEWDFVSNPSLFESLSRQLDEEIIR